MIDTMKIIYTDLEEKYDEADKYVSKIVVDSFDESVEYLSELSEDVTNYIDSLMADRNTTSEDPVLLQLGKLHKTVSSLDENNDDDWDSKLIYTATSAGHINEKITTVLYDYYSTDMNTKNTQSAKINSLKTHLSKTIINDLHFINSFRNSILHHNDYGHDLSNLDLVIKKKLQNEAQAALSKLEYVYMQLKDIKIQKLSNSQR